MNRNRIFERWFDLVKDVTFADSEGNELSFINPGRRFKNLAKVPGSEQPALFQTEHTDAVKKVRDLPYSVRLEGAWSILIHSGTDSAVPTETVNNLLDAIDAAIAPLPFVTRQTLSDPNDGDLVFDAFIEGHIIKVPGDDNGQGLIVIPWVILVP